MCYDGGMQRVGAPYVEWVMLALIGVSACSSRMSGGGDETDTGHDGTSCGEDCGETIEVPGGVFWMGCPDDQIDDCPPNALPFRQVEVSAFEIDRYETSSELYAACVHAGVCSAPEVVDGCESFRGFPVVCVSWNDARDYCHWAGKRLPTEAEWELAARGTDGRLYSWGNDPPSCELVVAQDGAPCPGDVPPDVYTGGPWPVGTQPAGASPYGALDMLGNVMEWVADYWADDYYAHAPTSDPPGPANGNERVLRGGMADIPAVHVYDRFSAPPDWIDPLTGFRCARSL